MNSRAWKVVRGDATAVQRQVLSDYGRAAPTAEAALLHEGHSRRTLCTPKNGAVWKFYHRFGARARWRALWGKSDVRREYDALTEARKRGFPVPNPLFAAERHFMGCMIGAVIVTEFLPDAVSAHRALTAVRTPGDASAGDRRTIVNRCAELTAALHDAGVLHGDLNPDNMLIRRRPEIELWIVDWLGASFSAEKADDRGRARELRLLGLNLLTAAVPVRDILEGYRAYCRKAGWPAERQRRFRRQVTGMIGRSIRNKAHGRRYALQETRQLHRRNFGKRFVICHKDYSLDVVTAAFAAHGVDLGRNIAGASRADLEIVPDDGVAFTWQTSCFSRQFSLPVRPAAAMAGALHGHAGWLAVERIEAEPLANALSCPDRRQAALSSLQRLIQSLHSFGVFFTACEPKDIGLTRPDHPLAIRTGGAIVLNPCVLRTAARAEQEASWNAVADLANRLGVSREEFLIPGEPSARTRREEP